MLQWCQSFIFWNLNCKFGSVAYPGHPNKLTELHLWKFKLEILQSQSPCRHPNTSHSAGVISDLGFFFYAFIFEWKNQSLLDIQEKFIRKLGKFQSELNFLFGVYYWFFKVVYQDHLSATVTSLHLGFCSERVAAGLGPSGLIYMFISEKYLKTSEVH